MLTDSELRHTRRQTFALAFRKDSPKGIHSLGRPFFCDLQDNRFRTGSIHNSGCYNELFKLEKKKIQSKINPLQFKRWKRKTLPHSDTMPEFPEQGCTIKKSREGTSFETELLKIKPGVNFKPRRISNEVEGAATDEIGNMCCPRSLWLG